LDNQGRIYVAGSTSNELEPGARVGGLDVYLQRWSADGQIHWTRQYGTVMDEQLAAVVLGTNQEVHLAGTTFGAVPGFDSAGSSDLFVLTLLGVD
jgi:hypothetical protein